jgi:hypothetical protein
MAVSHQRQLSVDRGLTIRKFAGMVALPATHYRVSGHTLETMMDAWETSIDTAFDDAGNFADFCDNLSPDAALAMLAGCASHAEAAHWADNNGSEV